MDTLLAILSESLGISTDSRQEMKDKIFFALQGEKFNGNNFAIQAISKGAICAVVDDEKVFEKAAKPNLNKLYFVDNALSALQQLALAHRQQFNIPIIAITGTNGKTTTKELAIASLSKKFNVIGTGGNLNNHIGVPLTLLKINSETDIAVIEMGANKKGDIEELCNISLPTHGVITNIGIAHLEGFKSKAIIAKTKGELYKFLNDNNGIIFINSSDKALLNLKKKIITSKKVKVILYGKEKIVDLKKTKLVGKFNIENMKTAKAIALHFDVPEKQIDTALSEYTPQNMRGQKMPPSKFKNEIVLDAYNANPSSMKIAIEDFVQSNKRKAIILGDMKELGKGSIREHVKIIRQLKSFSPQIIVLIGKEFYKSKLFLRKIPNNLYFFKDKESFKKSKIKSDIKNYLILIKGSRTMKMEELVKIL